MLLIAAPIHASYSSNLLVFKPYDPFQKYIIILDNLHLLLSDTIHVLCKQSEKLPSSKCRKLLVTVAKIEVQDKYSEVLFLFKAPEPVKE